jgi:hypothetical protein
LVDDPRENRRELLIQQHDALAELANIIVRPFHDNLRHVPNLLFSEMLPLQQREHDSLHRFRGATLQRAYIPNKKGDQPAASSNL